MIKLDKIKRYGKNVLCLGLTSMVTLSALYPPVNISASTTSRNGFTFDDSKYTIKWKTGGSYNVYTAKGDVIGTVSYVIGRARYNKKNSSKEYQDTLLVKMIMTPNGKHKETNRTQYGFSEYVSVKSTLPLNARIIDYTPKNDPSSDQLDLSIGADSGGPSIGASYSISHDDLDIESRCKTPNRLFHEVYNYKPTIANPFGNNKYLRNESFQFAMCNYDIKNNYNYITLSFDGRFGAAEDKACSPWCVIIDYVKSATRTVTFSVK